MRVPFRSRVTTTHDPRGGGMPKLIFAHDRGRRADEQRSAVALVPGVTVIGSGASADVRLPDVADRHAEIRRDEHDEYYLVHLGGGPASLVNGQRVRTKVLHTGDRIQIGGSTMSFYREEFADHGRPHGGRMGGQRHQPPQDRPLPRGTSDGRDRGDGDPGEYH